MKMYVSIKVSPEAETLVRLAEPPRRLRRRASVQVDAENNQMQFEVDVHPIQIDADVEQMEVEEEAQNDGEIVEMVYKMLTIVIHL